MSGTGTVYIANVKVDNKVEALRVIQVEHAEIHEGEHFFCSDADGDVDIGGPKLWRVTTAAGTNAHMTALFSSSYPGTLEVYENPTLSTAGTTLTSFNNDRNSSGTPTTVCAKDPTTSDDGTLMFTQVIGSDSLGAGGNASGAAGGLTRRGNELILKQDEDYIVKFTTGENNARVALTLEWYEETR